MDGEIKVFFPKIVRDLAAFRNVTVVVSQKLNGLQRSDGCGNMTRRRSRPQRRWKEWQDYEQIH